MAAAVVVARSGPISLSDWALKAAAGLWWAVVLAGQWAFFYYILAVYGASTFTGNFQAWQKNPLLFKGYVAGDTAGNLAFAAHALLAAVIAFGGTLQLVPWIRRRALSFHRWNGRAFLVAALAVSFSGLYMVWVRHANPNLSGALGTTLNAFLILAFVAPVWLSARGHDATRHRRWALRLFIVANGQFFTRVGVFAWFLFAHAVGLGKQFNGAFFLAWNFGAYLVPLAILELYLRAKDSDSAGKRLVMAGGLVAATIVMSVGTVGVSMFLAHSVLGKL